MFLLEIVFLGALLLSVAVLGAAARPTSQEKAAVERLRQTVQRNAEGRTGEAGGRPLLKQPGQGFDAWIEESLDRFSFYSKLELLIEQANAATTPGKVLFFVFGLGAAGFAASWLVLRFLPLALGVGAACAVAPWIRLRIRRARRVKACNAVLPEALDLMSRALRAGHAVSSAIQIVAQEGQAPLSAEFERIYQQQNFGLPFRDALAQMARRIPSSDLQFVITAMLVQKETGGNLTEILDRTTYVIRERLRIHGEVRVKTAQGRLTGWILSLLPVVMGVLINFVNPGYARPLFTTAIGQKMLYAAAGMLITGGLIIRKIVNIQV